MNLINILYEPYVIIIIISLILTLIAYYIVKNDNLDKDDEDKTNVAKALLYTFIISFIILMLLKYVIGYMQKNKYFQKGSGIDLSDKLTIVADDVEYGILDD